MVSTNGSKMADSPTRLMTTGIQLEAADGGGSEVVGIRAGGAGFEGPSASAAAVRSKPASTANRRANRSTVDFPLDLRWGTAGLDEVASSRSSAPADGSGWTGGSPRPARRWLITSSIKRRRSLIFLMRKQSITRLP